MNNENTSLSDCALLVVSCDGYSDLWSPFFTLLHRYWPDCPYPVFLGAGQMTFQGVTTLASNGGRDWSRCVLDYLDQLPHEHILMMLDDFFIRRTVHTPDVVRCHEFARTNNAIQLRLIPRPRPTDRVASTTLIGECAPGLPYRLCTQASFWNRKMLHNLLRPGETIWEFEQKGSERALAHPHGFYSVCHAVLPYEGLFVHHVVEKGKWFIHEKWIFKWRRTGCDFSRRGTLPLGQTCFYHLAAVLDRALALLPWQARLRIKTTMKKCLAPFFRRSLGRLRNVT